MARLKITQVKSRIGATAQQRKNRDALGLQRVDRHLRQVCQLEGNGLLGLLNVFSGGAFGNAAIFALGVMPYITASIIIQLMGIMIPYFQKMQKEGESGRRKMNQWTRMLTIIVLLIQGPAYITNLYHQVPEAFVYGNTFLFLAYATVILIAGTMFIMP